MDNVNLDMIKLWKNLYENDLGSQPVSRFLVMDSIEQDSKNLVEILTKKINRRLFYLKVAAVILLLPCIFYMYQLFHDGFPLDFIFWFGSWVFYIVAYLYIKQSIKYKEFESSGDCLITEYLEGFGNSVRTLMKIEIMMVIIFYSAFFIYTCLVLLFFQENDLLYNVSYVGILALVIGLLSLYDIYSLKRGQMGSFLDSLDSNIHQLQQLSS